MHVVCGPRFDYPRGGGAGRPCGLVGSLPREISPPAAPVAQSSFTPPVPAALPPPPSSGEKPPSKVRPLSTQEFPDTLPPGTQPYRAVQIFDPIHADKIIVRIRGRQYKNNPSYYARSRSGSQSKEATPGQWSSQLDAADPATWDRGELAISVPQENGDMVVLLYPFNNDADQQTSSMRANEATRAARAPPPLG